MRKRATFVLVLFVLLIATPRQATAYEYLPVIESIEFTDGGNAAITELNLSRPLGIHVDDLLLVVVVSDDDTASPFFNAVVNWTLLGESGDILSDCKIAVYYRVAEYNGGNQITVNSTSADNMLGWYIVLHGVDVLNPINAFNFAESSATGTNPHIIPSITTLNANSLVLYGLAFDGGDGYPMNVADPFTELSDRTNTAVPNEDYVSGSIGYKNKVASGSTENALVYTTVLDGAAYFQLAISGSDIEPYTPEVTGIFYDLFLSLEIWGYLGPMALVVAGYVLAKKDRSLGVIAFIVQCLFAAQYFVLIETTPAYWWHVIIILLGSILTCVVPLMDKR